MFPLDTRGMQYASASLSAYDILHPKATSMRPTKASSPTIHQYYDELKGCTHSELERYHDSYKCMPFMSQPVAYPLPAKREAALLPSP